MFGSGASMRGFTIANILKILYKKAFIRGKSLYLYVIYVIKRKFRFIFVVVE